MLNVHAHYHTLSNMLAFLEECLEGGWELRVCRPTLESSVLFVRCVRIGVAQGKNDL